MFEEGLKAEVVQQKSKLWVSLQFNPNYFYSAYYKFGHDCRCTTCCCVRFSLLVCLSVCLFNHLSVCLTLLPQVTKGHTAKFPTECFFMTAHCHHIALSTALHRYRQGLREIRHLRQVLTVMYSLYTVSVCILYMYTIHSCTLYNVHCTCLYSVHVHVHCIL